MLAQPEKTQFGIMISVTCLLCTWMLVMGACIYKRMPSGNSVVATGSASIDFESDYVVWRGSFLVHGATLQDAYRDLEQKMQIVKNYMKEHQIAEEENSFDSVTIIRKTSPVLDLAGVSVGSKEDGYDLKQGFVVCSEHLDQVSELSRISSELISTGVELESRPLEYYVDRETLDAVKLQLIDAASENARLRVQIMAKQMGARLGKLTSSSLGVFQITALNSGESYSSGGVLDTTSRYKTAMITVKVNMTTR